MAELSSMHERRLPQVEAHIEEDYRNLTKGFGVYQDHTSKLPNSFAWDYQYTGSGCHYSWFSLKESTETLLSEDGLRVLDLGCGSGGVVRAYNKRNPDRNKAFGITANTYGIDSTSLIVGNIHHLDDVLPRDFVPVDRMITNLMYAHLADPLSVLEMAARKVDKGGLMVIDGFVLRATRGSKIASKTLSYLIESDHFKLVGPGAETIERNYVERTGLDDDEILDRVFPMTLFERQSTAEKPLEIPVSYEINRKNGLWQYTDN